MSYSVPASADDRHPRTAHPDPSRSERVQIFALPTRTMYGSLRFSWLSYLGLAEQQHAAQLPTPTAAVSYMSTQALMRAIAATRRNVPSSAASEIEVDRTCTLCTSGKKHGKPRIAGVNFNMSQVHPLVVGAFSRNPELTLGVDVETLEARLFSGFARLALSDEERSFHEGVAQERPASSLHILSLALWTAKEAVLKATGYGLSVVPALVHVEFTEDLLDAIEQAMSEELPDPANIPPEDTLLPGGALPDDTHTGGPAGQTAASTLHVLSGPPLTTRATFSAPEGVGGSVERRFALQWIPTALPDTEHPEHEQRMLIALAVEDPAEGIPAHIEAQLLPVETPLQLKYLLAD